MKLSILQYAIVLILLIPVSILSQTQSSFQYVSPKPNSIMVSNETNIILRHATKLQESSIIQSLIGVMGSVSGTHTGDFLLTDDDQTIVFNPHKPFAYNEVVTVSVENGIKTITDVEVQDYSFSFEIEKVEVQEPIKLDLELMFGLGISTDELKSSKQIINKTLLDTLPADFPTITVDTTNNPSDGKLFLANLSGAFNT
ncbi:MAG: Ig-like domain-containing protein, partial [Ignavibacteriaceae bacterium]